MGPKANDAISSPPADAQTNDATHTPKDGPGLVVPGAGAIDPASALAQKLDGASASAVDQHLSETKRGHGQRGKDKRPRKPRAKDAVPVAEMGQGAPDALLEDATPTPLGGVVADAPPFDEETARQVIEIGVGLLNDGAAAIVRAIAKKETGDVKLAEEAAKDVRMGERVDTTIKFGAMAVAKKYAVRMEYAPEVMLGGGLVIWAGQIMATVRALKAKGVELREPQLQAA